MRKAVRDVADLFAIPAHSDTSSLFEAHYDGECGNCWRPFYEGERVGYIDGDTLACEQCYTQETR